MHRQNLRNLLDDYAVRYPLESDCVQRFRLFLDSYADCFERSQLSGHVTGSAWLVNRAGTHVLLTHHRKLDLWVQLGGHADGDTDILRVALTEAQEESGIQTLQIVSPQIFDLDIHPIPARGAEPEHFHYDVRFALQTVDSDDYTLSAESKALEWVEITRLAEKTNETSMLRMAEKWLSAL
ncbi:MAG: NUDIX hydrolase [Candidatus Competibacteraceae bacterium]|nr:NUDIX hydrolase [Candidatus Competibacteraceae bacterium]MCB1814559.1 NUDIX hydrolase [Candidatus Competibacteraceae bacterium]